MRIWEMKSSLKFVKWEDWKECISAWTRAIRDFDWTRVSCRMRDDVSEDKKCSMNEICNLLIISISCSWSIVSRSENNSNESTFSLKFSNERILSKAVSTNIDFSARLLLEIVCSRSICSTISSTKDISWVTKEFDESNSEVLLDRSSRRFLISVRRVFMTFVIKKASIIQSRRNDFWVCFNSALTALILFLIDDIFEIIEFSKKRRIIFLNISRTANLILRLCNSTFDSVFNCLIRAMTSDEMFDESKKAAWNINFFLQVSSRW
jgi:hypothetical protein